MDSVKKKIQELPLKLAVKWVGIPYAIMTVLVAGASYNLFAYFQQIGAAQGYGKGTMTMIKYTVLFGYYLGLLPGLVVKTLSPFFAFLVAAIQALIAFSTLGYIAENGEGGTFTWIVMICMLFIGAMSGSIATIGAVVTSVKNFPRVAGMLIVVIMISYFKVAPYFEFSVRSAFLSEVSLMWYFVGCGFFMALVFIGAGLAIKNAQIDDAIENVMKLMDRMAMLIFVAVEVVFLIGYFVASIILENWLIGAILFLSFILVNFIALVGAIGIVFMKARSLGAKDLLSGVQKDKFNEKLFLDYIKEIKYICLVICSFLVIGVTQTYNFNIFQIAFALDSVDSAENALDTFWVSDMFARIGGGLAAYFLVNQLNGYLFASIAAGLAAIGFGIALLVDVIGPTLFYISSFQIGIGNGLMWVIAPMIVMEDAGPDNFGLNWGLVLFANMLGIILYGELFDLWYEWIGEGDTCKGTNCILLPFIVFGVLGLIAAGLGYTGYLNDSQGNSKDSLVKSVTGKKGDKGKKDKKGDKDGAKSKEKGDKSKSDKGKKSKPKSKKK